MPAATTLKEIQDAMSMERVHADLDAYALGIFVNELHKYRKELTETKTSLKDPAIGSGRRSELLAKLDEFERQPDLGFYYTMALFHQLADTHPSEAQKMMIAVLSFDTMGRYLLNDRPVIVDGNPFVLREIFSRHGIDPTPLLAAAKKNQQNIARISDEAMQIEPIAPPPLPEFSMLTDKVEQTPELLTECRKLRNLTTSVATTEAIRKKLALISPDFSLVSQLPTEENVKGALVILAEMFHHAKIQDSAKLDVLNETASAGDKISDYSTVALLQNTVSHWLLLSLVQATTVACFDQRMRFIMAVFAEATKKSAALPVNATADMYFPLFLFAKFVDKSVLNHHVAVQENLETIRKMAQCLTPKHMSTHINEDISPAIRPLTPMRMEMTSQLALGKEFATFYRYKLAEAAQTAAPPEDQGAQEARKAQERIAIDAIARGNAVYRYFNPLHLLVLEPLEKMSTQAWSIFSTLPAVEQLFEDSSFFDLMDMTVSVFPVHLRSDSVYQQLRTLECALLSKHPKIIFWEQPWHLFRHEAPGFRCYEGKDALHYVKEEALRLLKNMGKRKIHPMLNQAGVDWCRHILTRRSDLKRLLAEEGLQKMGAAAAEPAHDRHPEKVRLFTRKERNPDAEEQKKEPTCDLT